jgi:hypothetical protein
MAINPGENERRSGSCCRNPGESEPISKDFTRNSVRIDAIPSPPLRFALRNRKRAARNAPRICTCHHAKSIHARMYANPELGTACNFPGCRCKRYRLAPPAKSGK